MGRGGGRASSSPPLGVMCPNANQGLPWPADVCFKGEVPMKSGVEKATLNPRCPCFCAGRRRGSRGPVRFPASFPPDSGIGCGTANFDGVGNASPVSLTLRGHRVLKAALVNFHEAAVGWPLLDYFATGICEADLNEAIDFFILS